MCVSQTRREGKWKEERCKERQRDSGGGGGEEEQGRGGGETEAELTG